MMKRRRRSVNEIYLAMKIIWFLFSNVIFEKFNLLNIFDIIRDHAPNFFNH